MAKKDKKKQQKGVPLSQSHLIKGGETGNRQDGRGRKLKRVILDAEVAGHAVSHIVNTLSVHGELFGSDTQKWYEDLVKPLIKAIDMPITPIVKTAQMVVMSVIMDRDTFENGLKTLIDRINKRVFNATSATGFPVKRVITFGYHLMETREWGKYVVGDNYRYCIIVCLPGVIVLPAILPKEYTEFYLRVGKYEGVDPLTDDEGIEFQRHAFEEFKEIDKAE